MRIGIDGTAISAGSPSGMTTYTTQIINSLLEIDDKNTYCIYCLNKIPEELVLKSSKVSFKVIKTSSRKLCQQTRLPLAALSDNLDLMFFPFNSASIFLRCKSVVTIHDMNPYVLPKQFDKVHHYKIYGNYFRAMLNRIYWKKIMKISSMRTDRIIAVSNSTKKDIENMLHIPSDKIDVVYNGINEKQFNLDGDIDLSFFKEKYSLPERYLLSVGTHAYKNLEGIINAFDIVKKKYGKSIKLVITGSLKNVNINIFRLIKDLNLEEHIIFTGYFPGLHLKYLYRFSDVFIFPSFYEGFGLPVLEAFACGTPVVTSIRASLPEVAGEAGLLVNPDNPEAIASAVLRFLKDNQLREKKRRQGFEQVAKFSWTYAARKTLEVFEKVI